MSKMTMEREISICERAVEKYGAGQQTDMMIEEASELIKALCKYRRAVLRGARCVEHNCKWDDVEEELANVLEELADVQIMLNQMTLIYGDFTEKKIAKLERLEKRLGMEAET